MAPLSRSGGEVLLDLVRPLCARVNRPHTRTARVSHRQTPHVPRFGAQPRKRAGSVAVRALHRTRRHAHLDAVLLRRPRDGAARAEGGGRDGRGPRFDGASGFDGSFRGRRRDVPRKDDALGADHGHGRGRRLCVARTRRPRSARRSRLRRMARRARRRHDARRRGAGVAAGVSDHPLAGGLRAVDLALDTRAAPGARRPGRTLSGVVRERRWPRDPRSALGAARSGLRLGRRDPRARLRSWGSPGSRAAHRRQRLRDAAFRAHGRPGGRGERHGVRDRRHGAAGGRVDVARLTGRAALVRGRDVELRDARRVPPGSGWRRLVAHAELRARFVLPADLDPARARAPRGHKCVLRPGFGLRRHRRRRGRLRRGRRQH